MEDLSKEEIMSVYGGDKFMRDLGHLCGDIVQAIEDACHSIRSNVAPGTSILW